MACRRKVPTEHLASAKSLYPLGQPGLRPAFSWKAIALIELSAKPGAVHGDDCRRHAQTGIGKELSVS